MRLTLAVCLLLVSLGAVSAPRVRSISHSEWRIDQQQVTLRVDFPLAEAAALVGKRYPLLTTEHVGKYVLERVGVSAGGQVCPATDQGYDLGQANALSLGSGLYGFEIVFRCAAARAFSLRNTLFMEDLPAHVDYAVVEFAGQSVPQLFTRSGSTLDIAAADPKGVNPARFARLGFEHLAGSLSRAVALLALLVLAGWRRRLWLLGGLSTGYVISWLLVFIGLQPEIAYLEAGVGFVSVGVALILVASAPLSRYSTAAQLALAVLATALAALHHPRDGLLMAGLSLLGGALLPLERLGRRAPLLLLAALFGVVDGFVLPGDFARLELERVDMLLLSAFDVGSLAGATILLVLGFGAVRLFDRSRLSAPKSAMRDLATSLLSGFGLFWMLSSL